MTDKMRASILAHSNMVNMVAPLLTREALQKFVKEEQKRIEQEKKQQQHRGDERHGKDRQQTQRCRHDAYK